MKRLLNAMLLVMAIAAVPNLLFGQRTITGTVTDAENGLTLIGANVLAVNADGVGTSTDIDGRYTLEVPAGVTKLRFSYTGYNMVEVELGAGNILDVQMTSGAFLDEVVVIGYGTVKREDATGSVASVGEETFNKGAINSPQELLAGKIAGVQITTNADPGGGAQIRIRGGSSLSASNDPLLVIDGIPVDNGDISGARSVFNFVNPNDIETFTVLKDASATAIYGSRASNGVILITTKKGALGQKLTVEYNGNMSFSTVAQNVDVLNAAEYRAMVEQQFEPTDTIFDLMGSADTDWQDAIYQTGVGQDHNLNFTGAIGELPYRVSVGYTNRDGILKTDNFQRTSGSINLSPKFLDNMLQINMNVKGVNIDNTFGNRDAIGAAASFDPTQPIYDEGNAYGGYFTWLQSNGNGLPNDLAPSNPLALIEQREDVSTVQRVVANVSADYRFHFLPELRANLNLGIDRSKGEGTVFEPENAAFVFNDANDNGTDNTYSQTKENDLLEFYLNYVRELGDNKFDVMGGYSWQRFAFEDEFFNSNIARTDTTAGDNSGELYLLSLFGRFNYTLQDRYLFTFTLRRDGTSRFSPDSRWGLFPAAAVGVKLFDGDGKGMLSNLKLRLGWGVTGQQDIGDFYVHLPRYLASFDNARYQFGDTFVTTLRPEPYDANIKWEETTTYNVALDYGLLDDRLMGSVEFYQRETKDLLNFIPIPAGTNLSNFIETNVGDLENRGVEFSVNAAVVEKPKLTWDLGFNFTYNVNEITKLTASEDSTYIGVLTGGISGAVGNTIQIHSVGYPSNSFYVREQVYNEDGVPIEGLYVDRNGDGIINEDDNYRLEKPAPDYYFGLTSNLTYGNFDFSFGARANLNNYVYNNIEFLGGNYSRVKHSTNYLQNVHSSANFLQFQNASEYFSDYFIQNASFLRVDHITLGYNFGSMIDKISFLKLYATVQNPILITDYEGIDPEIGNGIDNNIYPRSRTYVIGLNARF